MEVWAALSPLCCKAQDTKMSLSGQKWPVGCHSCEPEVTLTKCKLLRNICRGQIREGRGFLCWGCWALKAEGLFESGCISSCSGGGSAVSELELSLFSPLPQTMIAVFWVFPWAQSCDFSGVNGMKEILAALTASSPWALPAALPFGNHTCPGWERTGDVCPCHAHAHSSSAVLRHSWMQSRALCWSPLHPAWMCLNQGHSSQSFRNSLPIGVPREGTKCSICLKAKKQQEMYVCIFCWHSQGCAGCFPASNWLFC